MKKLFLSAAIILGSLNLASAYTPNNLIETAVIQQEEYTEIKLEEVPEPVITALKKAYPDAVLTKASKNANSQYKLDVTVGDKVGSLFANADGTWIQI
jgi:TRAP-type mannitol/chloroaromatic compound transport system substrate-binding protein